MAKTMSELKNELKKMASEGNGMIAKNEAITADFLAKLDELNGEYAKAVEAETYKTIGAKENPIIEAVKAYSFTVQRVTVIKDPKTKQIAEFKITERDKQIDLIKFCKANEFDTEWSVYLTTLNQALCMRVASELGLSKDEINEIAQSYYMKKAARKIAEGKPAISNNELCKTTSSGSTPRSATWSPATSPAARPRTSATRVAASARRSETSAAVSTSTSPTPSSG